MALALGNITFDCDDPGSLSQFWHDVTGWERMGDLSPYFAMLQTGEGGPAVLFIRVPEAKSAKNRCHPDLRADSPAAVDAQVQRLIALGATHLHTRDEFGIHWATFADTEGNEFCVGAPAEQGGEG